MPKKVTKSPSPRQKPQSEKASSGSPSKAKVKPSPSKPVREVLYPTVDGMLLTGDDALTAATARKLLGWQEEGENLKFKGDYLLTDEKGVKVRCLNNITNRPLYLGNVRSLKQEILNRRWRMNGEPIIIGKTGLVLNGQHQMIALILAAQYWNEHQGLYGAYWTSEPTIDKFLVVGVEECDDVVNTMDTCKPRSLADVIYRSEFFAAMSTKDRRNCANITSFAVKTMWDRTGASEDPYRVLRTHSESLDFIARHPRLLEAVKHVFEENGAENLIKRYVSLGTAAALLYLMGTSASEREQDNAQGYAQADNPSEAQLSFKRWDKACDFWVMLASQSESMKPVAMAMASLIQQELDGPLERVSLLVTAWNHYVTGKALTEKGLAMQHTTNDAGQPVLAEVPTVGGIDVGGAKTAQT